MVYICNKCPESCNDACCIYDGICQRCGALNSLEEVDDAEECCSVCNVSQEDYGFEFNQTHDGECICENCEDDALSETKNSEGSK